MLLINFLVSSVILILAGFLSLTHFHRDDDNDQEFGGTDDNGGFRSIRFPIRNVYRKIYTTAYCASLILRIHSFQSIFPRLMAFCSLVYNLDIPYWLCITQKRRMIIDANRNKTLLVFNSLYKSGLITLLKRVIPSGQVSQQLLSSFFL